MGERRLLKTDTKQRLVKTEENMCAVDKLSTKLLVI
jgi:hypothetical protein